MKELTLWSLLFVCLSFSLTSCMSEPEEEKGNVTIKTDENGDINIKVDKGEDIANAFKDVGEAMKKATESIGNVNVNVEDKNGEKIEVVDFRELKEQLPSDVAGLRRTDSSGQKTGALGFKISTAEGKYQEGNQKVEINIVDIGGVGMLANSMASWSSLEMDKESDSGYERTTMIDGHKAYIKWNSRTQKSQISVIVNERIIVNIEGRNVTMDDLEEALEDIDLDDLEDLVD